ncbi:HNH endonuclease signature motif containing protein [Tsukamurella sp. 1534]|uniref:HNH endonuclease signature motif containing protein n=1 Tax=Tsukamurella sp. 1534 TaxID=1151061 RepID=UPI001ED9B704|nr:HNH endonuclease signature motif containing protein [Tsukamurella sp. 1534]
MLDSATVLDSLDRLEAAARRVPYTQHFLTQVAVEQGVPAQLGYTGIKELLVQRLRLSGAEARDRVHGARDRVPQHTHGWPPDPRYALVAAAQREGAISERHAAAIERGFAGCRKKITPDDAEVLEDILVTAARSVTPEDITLIGKKAIEHIDPDGTEPKPDVIAQARALDVGHQDDDLMTEFDGALSPEGRALLDVVLEKLARPGVNNPDDSDAPVDLADPEAVRAAAKRDTRTTAQRNHDALVTALRMAVASGGLGQHRGLPCVPIITLGIDQLESETGIATTATGGRMPVADALRMMGANPKYVLVLDLASRPLFLGREKRLASADQRIALYGAEQGCTAPGCDAPATRCQVHHITEWADGGPTDIACLTLACDAHHGRVTPDTSDFPRGWETITVRDGEYAGRTGWRRTADPSGEYHVNHTHHTDELYRRALERWRLRQRDFRNLWRAEALRVQYEQFVGPIDDDIRSILDGPNGPPILESHLAEHDADDAWRGDESAGLAA